MASKKETDLIIVFFHMSCETCKRPFVCEKVRAKLMPLVSKVGKHHLHSGKVFVVYGKCGLSHLTLLRRSHVSWERCLRCEFLDPSVFPESIRTTLEIQKSSNRSKPNSPVRPHKSLQNKSPRLEKQPLLTYKIDDHGSRKKVPDFLIKALTTHTGLEALYSSPVSPSLTGSDIPSPPGSPSQKALADHTLPYFSDTQLLLVPHNTPEEVPDTYLGVKVPIT